MLRLQAVVLLLLSGLLLSACATHESETLAMRAAWRAGNTTLSKLEVDRVGDVSDSSADALIWKLEKGAVYRANGDIAESAKVLQEALNIVEKYEAEPDVTLTSEAASAIVNQSYIPYRGYAYDKIMLCAYLALDYMELGKFREAEAVLKRMQFFQENAFSKNLEEIERDRRAQEIASKDGNLKGANIASGVKNSALNGELKKLYGGDFDISGKSGQLQSARGNFVNPFSYFLSGMYFMARPADAADKNTALDSLRFASESLKVKNEELEKMRLLARELADGKIQKIPPCTFFIYESGCAPFRKQFKFGFPLYVFGDNLPYVTFNLPYLEKVASAGREVKISAGGQSGATRALSDMDSIIELEFKSLLPSIITRTIVSSAIKATAQYAAQAAVSDSGAKLIIAIAGSIYQELTNDADLRTWTTLPKMISIAVLENPTDGVFKLDGRRVLVDKNGVNVILIKRMSDLSPLVIRSFNLRK